ncbi:MAG: hypothetical protein BGO98_18610 [Myxococcales bacterium 68-20]|nr:hypothetical protein [Myxococcales bacterium]OJY24656.1 MAG: hypothetical protein BGO98_18610 [Myxococcales bacterium 68-20]
MIVTSNRDTAEWLAMFDDVLLAQSAVDRFRNSAYCVFYAARSRCVHKVGQSQLGLAASQLSKSALA